jgi:serpin B
MRNSHVLFSALFTFTLAACGGNSDSPQSPGTGGSGGQTESPTIARSNLDRDPASSVSTDTVAAVVDADNAFAFDLYGKVRATAAADNAVMSPLSVSLALGMTWAGARNQTADEMAKTLHFDAPGLDAHAGHNALSQVLESRAADALAAAQQKAQDAHAAEPSPDDFRLHIVNSVWGDGSYTWEQPFLDILARNYGTGVYLADFIHQFEAERLRINAWVSTETKDKIKDLLPSGSIDDSTRMVLVNALHLKMPWESPFEKSFTKAGEFTRGDGTTVSVDFMSQRTDLAYYEDATAQIVSLPLVGRKLSVTVVLPKGALADYEAGLTAATWKSAWQGRQVVPVALELPKFSFTSASIKLKDIFEELGTHQAFDPGAADFYGMCSQPPQGERLFIGEIMHKAMMAVDENGVEAAAATAVVMNAVSAPNPPQPVVMNVDRPFVVAIVDEPTGAVLFLGHIQDPTNKGSQ